MSNLHNKYKNDSGAASILIALLFALLFSTTAISYFMMEIYGITVIAPELNNKELNIQYSSSQNFATGDFDLNTMGKAINSKWVNVSGVGMILAQLGTHSWSDFIIRNVLKDTTGLYQNVYVINNSPVNIFGTHNDYCIILRFTGGVDQNEVCITNEGFEIPNYLIDSGTHWGANFFIPYQGANQIVNPTIKTVYNDKAEKLSLIFYFNGDKIFETTDLHEEGYNIFGQTRYYAGVSSNILGFALYSFETSGDIIGGTSGNDALDNIAGFLITVWKLATFSLPPEVPFPAQISFMFDIMVFGIFVCIGVIWRGSA